MSWVETISANYVLRNQYVQVLTGIFLEAVSKIFLNG